MNLFLPILPEYDNVDLDFALTLKERLCLCTPLDISHFLGIEDLVDDIIVC
jgi:hypothetical protein